MQSKTGSYVLLVENHEVMENSELKIMIYTLIFSILFFLSLRLRKGRFFVKKHVLSNIYRTARRRQENLTRRIGSSNSPTAEDYKNGRIRPPRINCNSSYSRTDRLAKPSPTNTTPWTKIPSSKTERIRIALIMTKEDTFARLRLETERALPSRMMTAAW